MDTKGKLLVVGLAVFVISIPLILPKLKANQPKPDSAEDAKRIDEIQQAVDEYRKYSGRFPSTLEELKPVYLQRIRLSSTNKPFIYDAQTGTVTSPNRIEVESTPFRTGSPTGGVGVIGDALTGMSVQQEMNY